jgi:hypothetical protein
MSQSINFFVSGARIRDTGKRHRDDLLKMVDHHGFDRGRGGLWRNLMMITQPLTKKMTIGRARLMIVMPSSKGKKIYQKGQLHSSLINDLGDARLQVRLTILH